MKNYLKKKITTETDEILGNKQCLQDGLSVCSLGINKTHTTSVNKQLIIIKIRILFEKNIKIKHKETKKFWNIFWWTHQKKKIEKES